MHAIFLTKECDYGVRIIRALADGENQTVKSVCDRELIPYAYAYKILKKLEHAGLLASHRGPNGGYQLAKDLESFSIYDVVVAVDANLLVSECMLERHQCPRNHPEKPCLVHREFCRLQSLLEAGLREKTMKQVLMG